MAKKKTVDLDYSEFQDTPGPGDNIMAQLGGLAKEQLDAEAEVARLEEELRKAQEKVKDISEHRLPTLMEEAKMESFVTSDGLKITLREIIRASIPEAGSEKAFDWLEDNGQGAMIKRQFVIEFGKSEDKWADKFERDLKARKRQLNVKRKKSVHSSTLSAFIREQLEEGVPIDMRMFGAFRQRHSKVETKDTKK